MTTLKMLANDRDFAISIVSMVAITVLAALKVISGDQWLLFVAGLGLGQAGRTTGRDVTPTS